jgi:predicted metal-dependent phosphoesterase TrpH
MICVEFHCHTIYSNDSLMHIDNLLDAISRKGIDRIAITDHNTILGALKATEIASEKIIIGEEIMTQGGELVAFFVKEVVPPGLSPEDTISRLRQQGAFICFSHPFDRFRKGHWEIEELERIFPHVDAIEIFNSRCINPADNTAAQIFANQHSLTEMVGSDAHTIMELGRSTLRLPDFGDSKSLRISLQSAVQKVKLSPSWIHLTSRYANWYKKVRKMSE